MTGAQEQLHAIIHGRVQGVNFRYYASITAIKLELTGWVRNLPDGTVEVTAEGTRAQLEQLVSFLRSGPPSAEVTNVDVRWLPATGSYSDFRVERA